MMITRNLQNVSKSASNSQKYALQHAQRNIMTVNNTLISNPISSSSSNLSLNNASVTSSNSPSITNQSLIHHSKYCFSKKTPALMTPSIADIIPSNIKLSVKEQESLQQAFNDLSNSGQTELIQIISEQLRSPRKPLQKAILKRIKAIDKEVKDIKLKGQSYLILSIVESTPTASLAAAQDEMSLLFDTPANKPKSDILQGIERTCQSNMDSVYHGWLNVSSKATTKGKVPSAASSFLANKLLPSKKTKRYLLATLPKSSLNAFKELIVYTLSLDHQMGGFHDTPKFAPSVDLMDTDSATQPQEYKDQGSGIAQDNPQSSSSKTIAKSTKIKVYQMPATEDIDDEWADPEDLESTKLDPEDDNMIVHEVEDINAKLKERADKQQYRAKQLNKWEMDLAQREDKVHKMDEDMSGRETNVTQQKVANEDKEKELLSITDNLKTQRLQNKMNASDLVTKQQTLNSMEANLSTQHKEQSILQKKLNQTQQDLDKKATELNQKQEAITKREQSITEREEIFQKKAAEFKTHLEQFKQSETTLNEKQKELDQAFKTLEKESKQLKQDREALAADKVEWNQKVKQFKEMEQDLIKKQDKYKQNMVELENEQKKLKEEQSKVRVKEGQNERRSKELDAEKRQLETREKELLQRENQYKQEQQSLDNQQKDLQNQRMELQRNQNTYSIQIKSFEENKEALNRDRITLEKDQKALQKQQEIYRNNMEQLNKDQKSLDIKLRTVENEKLQIKQQREDLSSQQSKLDESKEQLQKDRISLDKGKQKLKDQQIEFKETKKELDVKEREINNKFTELNLQRNELQNEQVKAKTFRNELNTKQKELEKITQQNEQKSKEIETRYNELKKEEKETLAKIEPYKQKEVQINAQEQTLQKDLKSLSTQQDALKAEQRENAKLKQELDAQSTQLKKRQTKLEEEEGSLQSKQDKLYEEDRRIVKLYDDFHKEKYEVAKLNHSLEDKRKDIFGREQKILSQQQSIDKSQREISEQTELITKQKNELKVLQENFDKNQKTLESQQRSYQEKSDKLSAEQAELLQAKNDLQQKQTSLKEEMAEFERQRHLMEEQKNLNAQKEQDLNIQRQKLRDEKTKIESNSLLLANRSQQLDNQAAAQNTAQSKLEKIKNDLQTAQKTHETENEKLRLWSMELQHEQKRLNDLEQQLLTQTKALESKTLKQSQQELEMQRLATSLQKEKAEIEAQKEKQIPLEKVYEIEKKEAVLAEKETALKMERDSQKQKEDIIKLSKDHLQLQQKELSEKERKFGENERKLQDALKEAEDTKYDLKIKITQKESEISAKEAGLKDRDIMLSKQERKIREKQDELKQAEDKLASKQNELVTLQRDLEIHKGQMKNEFVKNKSQIDADKVMIEKEKIKIMEQKEALEISIKDRQAIQSEQEEELNAQVNILKNKCDQLQNELHEMEANVSEKSKSFEMKERQLTEENVGLKKDKVTLEQTISDIAKKEKQQKRPIDIERRELKHQQLENERKVEEVKHMMTGVKRKENLAVSRANKVTKQEHELVEKQTKIQTQQNELDQMAKNLQIQLAISEKAEQAAKEAEATYIEKTKLITGLQQNLERTQQASAHKDLLINRLQNDMTQLKSQLEGKIIVEAPTTPITAPKQPEVASVPFAVAEPTSKLSKRNIKGIDKIDSKSIPINDPSAASPTILQPAHTQKDVSISTESESVVMHPTDTRTQVITQQIIARDEIPTKNVPSVNLSAAEPTSQISKRNAPKLPSYQLPQSIDTNIASTPSFTILKSPQAQRLYIEDEHEDLMPSKTEPTQPDRKPWAAPTDQIPEEAKKYSPYPPKERLIDAKVTATDESEPQPVDEFLQFFKPGAEAEDIVYHPGTKVSLFESSLPPNDTIPTKDVPSAELYAAEPTTKTSKRNVSKIGYVDAQSIPINNPQATSLNVVSSPTTVTDSVLQHPTETKATSIDSLPPKDTIPTANVESIPLYDAQPISVISKRNVPKFKYVTPGSIAINNPELTSKTVVATPTAEVTSKTQDVVSHPLQASYITIESLPPHDTIATQNVPSAELYAAEPTSVTSKRNQPKIKYIAPQSIGINDPKRTSRSVVPTPTTELPTTEDVLIHPTQSQTEYTDSLPPKDTIATADVPSADVYAAEPTPVTSMRNIPKIKDITPESIDINDPEITSKQVVSTPTATKPAEILIHPTRSSVEYQESLPPKDTIATQDVRSEGLYAAEPTSVTSKENVPKIQYTTPDSIDINDPQITSEEVVSSPTATVPETEEKEILIHPSRVTTEYKDSLPPKDTIATSDVEPAAVYAAEPTSVTSMRNVPKIEYIDPKSIDINDPQSTSQSVVPTPTESTETTIEDSTEHPMQSQKISTEPLPPRDTIVASDVESAAATPTASTEVTIDDGIHHPIQSQKISTESASPRDTIATSDVGSVNLSAAQPTPVISARNVPKIKYTRPQSIGICDPISTSRRVVPTPTTSISFDIVDDPVHHPMRSQRISIDSLPPQDTIATQDIRSAGLYAAEATSKISRHNLPKLPWFEIASAIPINDPTENLQRVLSHPAGLSVDASILEATDPLHHPASLPTGIDPEKFRAGLEALKKQPEDTEGDEVDQELRQLKDEEIQTLQFEPEPEPELRFDSKLTAQDLDHLFQCQTNPDLLFDDVGHLETIYTGLNQELQEYITECREYKSMINPLPSMFQKSILDIAPIDDEEIFTGDVILCYQWKFDNEQIATITNDLGQLIAKCDENIESTRLLIDEYHKALDDDDKRSISNRNKLRPSNIWEKENRTSIFDINANGIVQFKNDLGAELKSLQLKNTDWLILKRMLQEWINNVNIASENDKAAVDSADGLYLRAFCILPSQSELDRLGSVKHSNYLEDRLIGRQWIRQLNDMLDQQHEFQLLYGEMGPDVSNWEDKLLCRDLTAYLLNGASFELASSKGRTVPLSEGFVRIGYQAQLLIESCQSLLGHIDPYIEQIITVIQDWSNRDDSTYGHKSNTENIELSLKNGQNLVNIDPMSLANKRPTERLKMLENDAKYVSLFKDPLSSDLDELLQDLKAQNDNFKMDRKYLKRLHKVLSGYFQKLYRDKLMLPTPNSALIEETAISETWQKHALLEAVYDDEFGKVLQLLSNEKLAREICRFVAHDINDYPQKLKEGEQKQNNLYNQLFAPFDTFKEYHQQNIKQKLLEIVNDFDLYQYLSDRIFQSSLKERIDLEMSTNEDPTKKYFHWEDMSYTRKLLQPQSFYRDKILEQVEDKLPKFTEEERLATYWTGYLKGVLHGVPVERPLRLPEHYHDIEMKMEENSINGSDPGYQKHLKQHYYIDSYKPPSHEDVADRIGIEDKMSGVDIYRDKYIQRPHQSKRILECKLKFLYHNKQDYLRGAFPLENFNYLPYDTDKPVKHRVTVRKSPFVHARAQENYETRIYTKVATNYKLTSNRTADMFNARGFDIIYDSLRVM